ncbi:alpha/beta fold hydrolase [Cumulibacter soli]|uniref:alpha/beta fold hydrolase n=1 Tax=Cumulibacter soli TaxID=2546344 RepID=UPI00141A4F29|nr:alpha/beta fold hydrolase [Cumulibacter soli]
MPATIVDPTSRITPWPGRFERVTTTIGGQDRSVNLYARHTPGPPNTTPFFHVHGLGGSATNWTDLATALQRVGASIALDLPGWGESDPAPDGNYSITAASRWTIAAIEAVADRPVHLVGNSMGGLISIRVAAMRPDLVETLTLISPAVPGFEAPTDADPRLALLAVPFLGDRLQQRYGPGDDAMARAKMSAAICFAHPENIPYERLLQQRDEVAVRAGYPWANAAFSGSLRGLVAAHLHRRKDHPWRLAATLDVPTTIIWGAADRLVPVKRAPKLGTTISGSQVHILDEVGHTAQLEAPVETAEFVVDLVRRASAGREAA